MKDKIIALLQENARISIDSMATMLGATSEEVDRVIQELEKDKTILGYTTIVDHDKTDRQLVTSLIEVKITPERGGGYDRIAERIAKFREVKTCYLLSGTYDLLVVVEATDLKEVARFVSEKLATIGGVLSTVSHFMLKPYKEHGMLHTQDAASDRLKVSP